MSASEFVKTSYQQFHLWYEIEQVSNCMYKMTLI